jgi:hypothetical protein
VAPGIEIRAGCLSPGQVQARHELTDERVSIRVRLGEVLELAARLERGEPLLIEACGVSRFGHHHLDGIDSPQPGPSARTAGRSQDHNSRSRQPTSHAASDA